MGIDGIDSYKFEIYEHFYVDFPEQLPGVGTSESDVTNFDLLQYPMSNST